MTNEHVLVSEWITTLSLAVELKDEFAPHLDVRGNVTLKLIGGNRERAVEQPGRSGYYLFRDVPNGSHQLETEAYYYVHEPVAVMLPRPDPKSPVMQLLLKPNPSYSFPEGTTLLKGIVIDASKRPLPDVRINVVNRSESTLTTSKGAFVLYFKTMAADTLAVILRLNRAGGSSKDISAEIKKGKVVLLGNIEYP